jgi:hypothetical protein
MIRWTVLAALFGLLGCSGSSANCPPGARSVDCYDRDAEPVVGDREEEQAPPPNDRPGYVPQNPRPQR